MRGQQIRAHVSISNLLVAGHPRGASVGVLISFAPWSHLTAHGFPVSARRVVREVLLSLRDETDQRHNAPIGARRVSRVEACDSCSSAFSSGLLVGVANH